MPHDEFDIVIVGAGAAGLAAGRRLAASGLSFLVLEARDRPGGRAWTTRLANGEVADLGCGWLHSAETNPLAAIAESQGRTIDKSPPPWSRTALQVGENAPRMAAFSEAIARFRQRVEERAPVSPDVACDALLDPGDPFNALIDAISTYYSGAELAKVSVADLAAYEDSGVNWRVREGLGSVVAGLAEGAQVRYNCPVRAIARGAKLAIETDQGALRAEAAIVTLPSNVIAETPDLFRPALADKTEAASGLPLGLADKLYLELLAPQDFPEDSRAFGDMGRSATAAYNFRPLGRPLIEAYFGGDLAESLERGGGVEAAADFALAELTGLFGADFRKTVRVLRFHGWRTDAWARGAYSYARPGFTGSRARLAAAVEDRLFFAGEACSAASFSTAHGAYETGLAAAEAALAALRRRHKL